MQRKNTYFLIQKCRFCLRIDNNDELKDIPATEAEWPYTRYKNMQGKTTIKSPTVDDKAALVESLASSDSVNHKQIFERDCEEKIGVISSICPQCDQ